MIPTQNCIHYSIAMSLILVPRQQHLPLQNNIPREHIESMKPENSIPCINTLTFVPCKRFNIFPFIPSRFMNKNVQNRNFSCSSSCALMSLYSNLYFLYVRSFVSSYVVNYIMDSHSLSHMLFISVHLLVLTLGMRKNREDMNERMKQ